MNISKTFWTITALVVGSILITGCSNGSNAMGDELEGLQEALSMTPDRADLNAFIFSNWLNGQPENSEPIINSNSSLGDRWMWGIADLDWEVEMDFAGGGAPVRLFKFNNEFDFAPVMAVYEERGFGREELGGAILYTHEQDMSSNPPIIPMRIHYSYLKGKWC